MISVTALQQNSKTIYVGLLSTTDLLEQSILIH